MRGFSRKRELCDAFNDKKIVTYGTIDFSSEITIPPNFTAERAENADTLENPSGVWNTLKLCALCDLRVDKSLVFSIVPLLTNPAAQNS